MLAEFSTRPDAGSALFVERRSAGRTLADKLFVAFHHACDTGELDIARRLLVSIEDIMKSHREFTGSVKRKAMEGLVAGHERLWSLRHVPADVGEQGFWQGFSGMR